MTRHPPRFDRLARDQAAHPEERRPRQEHRPLLLGDGFADAAGLAPRCHRRDQEPRRAGAYGARTGPRSIGALKDRLPLRTVDRQGRPPLPSCTVADRRSRPNLEARPVHRASIARAILLFRKRPLTRLGWSPPAGRLVQHLTASGYQGDSMIRLLVSGVVYLVANAIGLLVANALLDDMSVDASAFVIALLIFTGVEVLVQPLITQIAIKNANALVGSSAFIATLIGLIVTVAVSDGLAISGLVTWVLATVIVWAAALLAGIVLRAIFVKRVVGGARA